MALSESNGRSRNKQRWLLYLYIGVFALAAGTTSRLLSSIDEFKMAPLTGLTIGLVAGFVVVVFNATFLRVMISTSRLMRRDEEDLN
jgi:TRAP-type C4-dicarboxylate transport system permease small subunit